MDRDSSNVIDYTNFRDIEKIEENKYVIKHNNDEERNITVTVEIDEDDKKVYYDGLPRAAAMYVQT